MQAKVEFDLEVQKIKYQGNTNITDLAELKLKEGSRTQIDESLDLISLIDEVELKKGSRTKIDKSLDLTFPIKIFFKLTNLYFSTLGAEEFQATIEERWDVVKRALLVF